MALIKHTHSENLTRSAVVLDLGDLARQGQVIIHQARQEALAIAERASKERQDLLTGAAQQGRAEGYANGYAQGLAKGTNEAEMRVIRDRGPALEALQASFAKALTEFTNQREDLVQAATRDVVLLAAEIAGLVIKRSIELDPMVVVDQVKAVVQTITSPTAVLLKINPMDRGLVEGALPGLIAQCSGVWHVSIEDDSSVARGGCVCVSRGDGASGGGGAGGGLIDATVRAQLDRIVESLVPGSSTGNAGEERASGGVKSW